MEKPQTRPAGILRMIIFKEEIGDLFFIHTLAENF